VANVSKREDWRRRGGMAREGGRRSVGAGCAVTGAQWKSGGAVAQSVVGTRADALGRGLRRPPRPATGQRDDEGWQTEPPRVGVGAGPRAAASRSGAAERAREGETEGTKEREGRSG
jgi:hypothetical protein